MNKAELAARIAERLGLTKKQGEDIVESFTSIVTEQLSEQEEVTIAGFGTFSSRIRAARMGVNPQKPSERIHVPEVLVPKFKAGKALKDALKAAQKSNAPAVAVKEKEELEELAYPAKSVPASPPQDSTMPSQVDRPHGEDSNPRIQE
ncbi:HU family DNA-binding protein [Candidatus Uhrbacteria bacterium]|nr:HU family DNA-binding protein [Candidatus Uhrbacteria bacterium]